MSIKFKCPSCEGDRLECCMNGPHVCPVTEIDEEGDFEYGNYESSSDVDRFQCLTCGFVLSDDNTGETILHNSEVVEWCLKNCSQE